jgi:predicted dehydrogenase
MVSILQSCGTELEIVCAVEPNPAAGDFCANNGLTVAASYDAALARADVDAVILATPHSLHLEQIDRGAAARKHIVCEKPLALTKADAERAVRLCRETGLVLGMGHERRFEPPIVDILQKASGGHLGRILQIEAYFSHDKFIDAELVKLATRPPAGSSRGDDCDRYPSDRFVCKVTRRRIRCARLLRDAGLRFSTR